jgi:hypothetical protein
MNRQHNENSQRTNKDPQNKLLNQGFTVVNLVISFSVATMTWLTITEYLCHKWPRICSVCNHALSLFMTWWKFTKNKQRSIKLKIDQRQHLKNRGEFMCSGRVNRCCSISGTRRVTHVWVLIIKKRKSYKRVYTFCVNKYKQNEKELQNTLMLFNVC